MSSRAINSIFVIILILSFLPCVGLAGTAEPQKQATPEEKTLYAVGLVISRQLGVFNLSNQELEIVKQGLVDGFSGKQQDVQVSEYEPKIQELAKSRRKALGERVALADKPFVEEIAKENGAVKTAEGLIYLPLKEGTGTTPGKADIVKVHYRGAYPNGTEFDSSYDRHEPVELKMDGVIKCWSEGLQKMKTGGKSKLVCPPEMAYGEAGLGDAILPYATLVFEVELLDVRK